MSNLPPKPITIASRLSGMVATCRVMNTWKVADVGKHMWLLTTIHCLVVLGALTGLRRCPGLRTCIPSLCQHDIVGCVRRQYDVSSVKQSEINRRLTYKHHISGPENFCDQVSILSGQSQEPNKSQCSTEVKFLWLLFVPLWSTSNLLA